jgi:hypothetical protein
MYSYRAVLKSIFSTNKCIYESKGYVAADSEEEAENTIRELFSGFIDYQYLNSTISEAPAVWGNVVETDFRKVGTFIDS